MVNPQMVILAREAAGETQTSAAQAAGVSQALMSKLENGFETPAPDVLAKLAAFYLVPVEFFDQQDQVLGEGIVDFFHKKRATLPAKPLRRANALTNVFRLQTRRALSTLELLDVMPLPHYPEAEHESPEQVAQMVRATWRVPSGPIPDVIALIEAAAVPVLVEPLGHEKLFAISMPSIDGRHVVVLNSQLDPSVQRFALAHELAHLVMHGDTPREEMERSADRFAAEFLMPAEDIRSDLRHLRFGDLGGLKQIWRVPMAALIRRAHDLGELTDRQYRTFFMQLSQLPGGRRHEPGEFAPDKPRFMRHILEHYTTALAYTGTDVARLLVASPELLEERYFDTPRRTLRSIERPLHSVRMPK